MSAKGVISYHKKQNENSITWFGMMMMMMGSLRHFSPAIKHIIFSLLVR
jgi:hypothetical protein